MTEKKLKDKNKKKDHDSKPHYLFILRHIGILTRLAFNLKMPKEPSRQSHSKAQIDNRIEQGQHTIHGIFHSGYGFGGISGNLKYIYFGKEE